MRRSFFLLVALLVMVQALQVKAIERLRLATTTSTENSGLLRVLLPPFEERFRLKVDVIAVGTGKALKLAENGDVDVVLVHAPRLEEEFVKQGYGVNRRRVMYNDFVLVGPEGDPAGIGGASTVREAFRQIAEKKATFISRGDGSGTNMKELEIWRKTGIRPQGGWYLEVGRGMGEVLIIANEKGAYTLSDRGTYLAFQDKLDLEVVFEGDPLLHNPYSIIAVNPAKHPQVRYLAAMMLIGWMTSPQGQRIIGEFGRERYGRPLFIPLAIPHPLQ